MGYAEHDELLAAAGAEVVTFDPLAAERLPGGTDALVVGGGFPEGGECSRLGLYVASCCRTTSYYAKLGVGLGVAVTACTLGLRHAFARPVRKVYYNLVITGLSIAAAFLIGTIEMLGVLAGAPIRRRAWTGVS